MKYRNCFAGGVATVLAFVSLANASAETVLPIETYTPSSYTDILDASYVSATARIEGILEFPEGAAGAVPVVVLLHGSGGVRDDTEGALAASLLLAAEFSLVLQLRGIPLDEYFAQRDPVAGTAYYLAVVLFAIMPLLVNRRSSRH